MTASSDRPARATTRHRSSRARSRAARATPYSFAVFGDWGYVHRRRHQPRPGERHAPDRAERRAVRAHDRRQRLPVRHPAQLRRPRRRPAPTRAASSARTSGRSPARSIPLFPAMGNHGFSGATTALNNWPQDKAVASSNGRYARETYCCLNGTTSGEYPSTWYAFDAGNARFYVLEAAWTSTNPGTSTQYGNDYAYHWTTDERRVQVAPERPRDATRGRSSSRSSTTRCTRTTRARTRTSSFTGRTASRAC